MSDKTYVVLSQSLNICGRIRKPGELFATIELAEGVTLDHLKRALNYKTYRFTTTKPEPAQEHQETLMDNTADDLPKDPDAGQGETPEDLPKDPDAGQGETPEDPPKEEKSGAKGKKSGKQSSSSKPGKGRGKKDNADS
jgi:hypothetical protein